MFNIGDVVMYSAHGVSKIDNICEKTYSNVTKTYYELHPLEADKFNDQYPGR